MISDEPDYSSCTYQQLLDIKKRINKDAFPERYELLLKEIELKSELQKIEYAKEIERIKGIEPSHLPETLKFNKSSYFFDLLLYPILYSGIFALYQKWSGVDFFRYGIVTWVAGSLLMIPLFLHWVILARFYFLNHSMEIKFYWNREIVEVRDGKKIVSFKLSEVTSHYSEYCSLRRLPWSDYSYTVTRLRNGKQIILTSFICDFELPVSYELIVKSGSSFPYPYQKQNLFAG